jgi:hypothetical protein
LPEQCPNEPSVVELESFWYNPFTCAGLFLISQILFFRITGFEALGNTDSFQTNVLEKRFGETGTFRLFIMLTHLYT